MLELSDPIARLPSATQALALKLNRDLGIQTLRDLLWHIPSHYEDVSRVTPIAKLQTNTSATIQGTITQIRMSRTWKRRMIIIEALLSDSTGTAKITWFGQPWVAQKIKEGDILLLSGKHTRGPQGLYFAPSFWEKTDPKTQELGLLAIYPEVAGVTSRWLRFLALSALKKLVIADPLPETLLREHNLLPLKQALWQVHLPKTLRDAENAKRRLAFEELLAIECAVLLARARTHTQQAPAIPLNATLIQSFVKQLPWALTDAQRTSAYQILKDMEHPYPMNRLLAGEVGSGKTIVAAIAMLNAAKQGWQSVLMAPTEILAQQHFKTIADILRPFRLRVALLTGSTAKVTPKKSAELWMKLSRPKMWEQTQKGEIDVLVGTHALISGNREQGTGIRKRTTLKPSSALQFKALGLAIVDEQHRFGVNQRAHLAKLHSTLGSKPRTQLPHLLTMTATPIPRSLALTIFGDLDLSTITELPKERLPITCEIVPSSRRSYAYECIRKELSKGRQAFVICPLVRRSEKLQARAAEAEYERLAADIFPDYTVGLLHGQMDAKRKEKTMHDVKKGRIDVLVATSVMEVGIDIQNATIIAIEGAERFGLSQLYQLRGRVGRGAYASTCLLIVEVETPTAMKRLRAMTNAASGPELAKQDLKIRGAGDLAGTRQSGIPDIAMQSLFDIPLIETARETAKELLVNDPALKRTPGLQERVQEISRQLHLS